MKLSIYFEMSVTSGLRMNLDSTFCCDSSFVYRVCALLCIRRFFCLMVVSELSAAVSMIERLKTFALGMGGVLAEDQESGVVVVTDLVVMICAGLEGLQGGTAEVKGEVHGGLEMDVDVMMLLCQSAQGTYVLRTVRKSAWLALFSSGIVAEAPRQAAAEQAARGMAALALGEAGEGQARGPVQVPEASARGSERSSRKAPSQRREPAPLLSKEERAESRQAYLSRSISRAESNVESLQSELLGRQAAAARRTSDDLEVVAELQLKPAPIAAPAQAVAAATAAAQQAAASSTSQQAWSAQQAAAHATAPRAGSATALQAAAAAAAQQAAEQGPSERAAQGGSAQAEQVPSKRAAQGGGSRAEQGPSERAAQGGGSQAEQGPSVRVA